MPEKRFVERKPEAIVPQFILNFLGDMPGYNREYRLCVESGASTDDLWEITGKLKKTIGDSWEIHFRGDRAEIVPPENLLEPHQAVAAAVQKAIGQAKMIGNIVTK